MPLPGSTVVSDDFRAGKRDPKESLYTRIEQKRNLNRPTNSNDLNPRAPDWLQASQPQTALTEKPTQSNRLTGQLSSVNSLGNAANQAVESSVEWQRQAAAQRALAKSQALSERQSEMMKRIGEMDWGIGSGGMDGGGSATGKRAAVINMGKRLLGQPYLWGGGHGNLRVGPVDCSGLVRYAFGKAGFKNVPGVSQSQMQWGKRTSISKLLPGDLVGRGSPATHVAIYLGNGKILEAQKSGTRVHIRSIKGASGWWGVHLNY